MCLVVINIKVVVKAEKTLVGVKKHQIVDKSKVWQSNYYLRYKKVINRKIKPNHERNALHKAIWRAYFLVLISFCSLFLRKPFSEHGICECRSEYCC